MSLTVRAPAKINLHLGVGAPRPDGYHPLTTVYQAVGLYDDLTANDPEGTGDGWSVGLAVSDWMDHAQVPLDGDNIVDRAAALLAAHHGLAVSGRVHIDKAIPVAGGMAGGSADAAAALVALDRLWGAGTSDADLLALAAQLGSDVPFALVGGTALGSGRGELVEPVADSGSWWWVVVPSTSGGLSTPEIYRHFDRLHPDAPEVPPMPEALLAALAAGDPQALAASLHNDLQAAAVEQRPDLATLIDAGEDAGALRGLVTGSGPTCVFLCDGPDAARAVGAELRATYDVVLVTHGAVAGAHTVTYG